MPINMLKGQFKDPKTEHLFMDSERQSSYWQRSLVCFSIGVSILICTLSSRDMAEITMGVVYFIYMMIWSVSLFLFASEWPIQNTLENCCGGITIICFVFPLIPHLSDSWCSQATSEHSVICSDLENSHTPMLFMIRLIFFQSLLFNSHMAVKVFGIGIYFTILIVILTNRGILNLNLMISFVFLCLCIPWMISFLHGTSKRIIYAIHSFEVEESKRIMRITLKMNPRFTPSFSGSNPINRASPQYKIDANIDEELEKLMEESHSTGSSLEQKVQLSYVSLTFNHPKLEDEFIEFRWGKGYFSRSVCIAPTLLIIFFVVSMAFHIVSNPIIFLTILRIIFYTILFFTTFAVKDSKLIKLWSNFYTFVALFGPVARMVYFSLNKCDFCEDNFGSNQASLVFATSFLMTGFRNSGIIITFLGGCLIFGSLAIFMPEWDSMGWISVCTIFLFNFPALYIIEFMSRMKFANERNVRIKKVIYFNSSSIIPVEDPESNEIILNYGEVEAFYEMERKESEQKSEEDVSESKIVSLKELRSKSKVRGYTSSKSNKKRRKYKFEKAGTFDKMKTLYEIEGEDENVNDIVVVKLVSNFHSLYFSDKRFEEEYIHQVWDDGSMQKKASLWICVISTLTLITGIIMKIPGVIVYSSITLAIQFLFIYLINHMKTANQKFLWGTCHFISLFLTGIIMNYYIAFLGPSNCPSSFFRILCSSITHGHIPISVVIMILFTPLASSWTSWSVSIFYCTLYLSSVTAIIISYNIKNVMYVFVGMITFMVYRWGVEYTNRSTYIQLKSEFQNMEERHPIIDRLINSIGIPIAISDETGKIEKVNNAFYSFLNYEDLSQGISIFNILNEISSRRPSNKVKSGCAICSSGVSKNIYSTKILSNLLGEQKIIHSFWEREDDMINDFENHF